MTIDLDRVQRAQDRLLEALADVPDVNGVGIGKDGDTYVLMVNLRVTAAASAVPDEVDGVPVAKRTVGTIRKRGAGP